MKIILNFLPLKAGGGAQVGLDFLSQAGLYGQAHEWYLVARENTPFTKKNNYHYLKSCHYIADNFLARLYFENLTCKKLINEIKPDLIYTQFGPFWPAAKHYKNIVGCAYSNLFYPEIDFWGNCSFFKQLERRLVDFLRKSNLKKADKVIFETQDLAFRAVQQAILSEEKACYVLPAISSNITSAVTHKKVKMILDAAPVGFRLCLISVYSINKNFEILIDVLSLLKKEYSCHDIYFVFTLDKKNKHVKKLLDKARFLKVDQNIINLGEIPFEACTDVYRACNATILPANLESFSNNIIESWVMKKPLLISDMDWARSLCGAGAIYINHTDVVDIANKILELKNHPSKRSDIVITSTQQLEKYPTSKGRFLAYLDIIEKSVNNYV